MLIVSGFNSQEEIQDLDKLDLASLVKNLVEQGNKPNQAIKKVAKDFGLSRQEVYNIYHGLAE